MTTESKSGLTERQIQLLTTELVRAGEEIRGRGGKRVPPPAPAPASGEPSGDAADQAEIAFEQGLLAALSESDRQHLRDIDDALARMDRGVYGICEATGEPIGFRRL